MKRQARRFFAKNLWNITDKINKVNDKLGDLDVNPNDIEMVKKMIADLDSCAEMALAIGDDIIAEQVED